MTELDEKNFQVKPKNSKCKGHKFHGLIICDMGDSFGIRTSGDKPIVFHCKSYDYWFPRSDEGSAFERSRRIYHLAGDDERIMEAFGDMENEKDTLCKDTPLSVSDLPLDDEEPKAAKKSAGSAAPAKAKKAEKPAKPAIKAAPKAAAAKPAAKKATRPAKAAKKPASAKKSSKK